MTFFGDSAANPPEVNYYTLTSGDHAASAADAAAGYQALAQTLTAEMAAMGSNTAMTAAVGWQGLGGAAMTMTAEAFMGIMAAAVAWLEEAFAAATDIVTAYHTAETSMIPGQVCTTNRTTQAGLIATNVIGQNSPAIAALEAQYQEFWIQNASVTAAYHAVLSAALAVLATPPPVAPMAPNPAGALAAVAQAGAQAGAQGALQASSQTMTQTANTTTGTAGQAAAAPGEAMSAMGAPMAMLGQVGQFGQMAGQLPQMAGQLPQMLGSAMQMPMGMLGSLSQGMGGLGGSGAGMEAVGTAGLSTPLAPGVGALGAGGGGGGIGSAGSGVVPSSFTRPVGSFSTPTAPKLPGGWGAVPEPLAGAAQPSGVGSGGLYGAPMGAAAAGQQQGSTSQERPPTRTLQISMRSAGDRGDR